MTFNDTTKDAAFCTSTSRFVAWLGFSRSTVRSCGCRRMIFRTPPGHRPRLWSSVTCTPTFLPTMTVRRAVLRPSHSLVQRLVVDAACRTESLSRRRLLLSFYRNLTGSMRHSLRVGAWRGRFQCCRHPHPPSAQAYAPDPEALAAVSSPPADIHGLTPRRAAPPSHAAAHRRHCRGLRLAD